jgi:hypothetical protein
MSGDTAVLQIRGAYVSPDKAELFYSVTGLDEEVGIVVIGAQQWVKFGQLVTGPTPFDGPISDLNLAVSFGDQGLLSNELSCHEGTETINGIAARRCDVSQSGLEDLTSALGATEDIGQVTSRSGQVWLHENDNWPVRLQADIAGTDETGEPFEAKFSMDVTEVGASIDIQPPTS